MFFEKRLIGRNVSNYQKPVPIGATQQTYSQPAYVPPPQPVTTPIVGGKTGSPLYVGNQVNGGTYVDPNSGLTVPTGSTSQEGRTIRESQGQGGVNITDNQSSLQYQLDNIDKKWSQVQGFQDPAAIAAEKNAAIAQFKVQQDKQIADHTAAVNKQNASINAAKAGLNPQGAIAQNAVARMRKAGMTDEQIRVKVEDPKFQAGLQGSFNTTDTPSVVPAVTPPATTTNAAVDGSAAPKNTAGPTQAPSTGSTSSTASPTDTSANPETAVTGPLTPEGVGIDSAFANLPPEAQFLAPFLANYKATIEQSLQENAANAAGQISILEKSYGSIHDQLDTMASSYKSTNDAMQSLLKEAKDSNEKYLAEQQKADQSRLQLEEDRQTRTLSKQQRQVHEANIVQLALSGAGGQDASIRAVNEADAEFDQRMSDLQVNFTDQAVQLSAKYSGMYLENNNNYIKETLGNMKQLQTDLQQITFKDIGNTQSKVAAEQTVLDKALEKQSTLRTTLAKSNLDIAGQIHTLINEKRDDDRAQEQNGWNILNQAIDNYGSLVPKSIIDRVQKMLPAGTDINDVINTPTFAERNSKRIAGAGGAGSGGIGSYDIPSNTGPGAGFSDVTPSQLKGAVDRIFAPANYGGTAGERTQKRADYMNRIASGESPVSIMNSLQGDYWASQKGAPRTAHDGRTEAQASAESLQSFVDFYQIGDGNDGPLGAIDSRREGLASVFGMSSEEYNNLATNVGNIRARIIKENYGAAVTPQELKIAQSYIPSMSDKGAQFLTKLQNLKSYNAYLDGKVFAAQSGLPPPKAPLPVSVTGNGMSGASKYSPEDILNALK